MSFTVDWDMALASVNQDRNLLRLVINAFLKESTVFQEQLSTAISTDDPKTLQRSGHTLKGTMLSLGAERWAQIAQQLEELGAKGTTKGAAALASQLKEQLPSLLEQLDSFSVEQSS
jgi:HPt (histidine-containing phosphotransfer) domain-containing protein